MSGFNVAVAQLMSQELRLSTQPFEEKDPFVMDAVPFSRKKRPGDFLGKNCRWTW